MCSIALFCITVGFIPYVRVHTHISFTYLDTYDRIRNFKKVVQSWRQEWVDSLGSSQALD